MYVLEAAFLLSVTGISFLFGFGRTFTATKKQDPTILDNSIRLNYEAVLLAKRALGWGTLCAFTTIGLVSYGIWKSLGVHDVFFCCQF